MKTLYPTVNYYPVPAAVAATIPVRSETPVGCNCALRAPTPGSGVGKVDGPGTDSSRGLSAVRPAGFSVCDAMARVRRRDDPSIEASGVLDQRCGTCLCRVSYKPLARIRLSL